MRLLDRARLGRWGLSSAGRARAWHARGREFKPRRFHARGLQLRQRSRFASVDAEGSIPSVSTSPASRKTVICLVRIEEKPGSTPGGLTFGYGEDGNLPARDAGETLFDSGVPDSASWAERPG